MCTTLPRSTSLLLLVVALLASVAMPTVSPSAQDNEKQDSKSGNRSRINWPRTFGGQPDFEFTRTDVIKEVTDETTKQGLPAPEVPTMADLLEDTTLSPLMLEEVSATVATVSGTAVDASGTTTLSTFVAEILPEMKSDTQINLTEFRTLLTSALAQQVKTFRLEDSMDASYLLRQLKLQSVVRSPIAYATINETRYNIGDTLTLPLMAGPSDTDQLNLLNSLLPPAESMTPDVAAQYQAVLEDVIKELAGKKNTNPAEYQKVFDLPVTLMEIQPRTVIVQFQGQKHELKIPYLY